MIRTAAAVLCGLFAATTVQAEPYLAVQQGMKCGGCHVNPSGGGQRNAFGNIWAQTGLPARPTTFQGEPWTGALNEWFAVGANARGNWRRDDVPGSGSTSDTMLQEIRVYLQVTAIPDRLTLHVDQHVAPNENDNREAYARVSTRDGAWYVKAGRMYLPYGLRLEDDGAYIRQVPGISFATPDHAVELGWEKAQWTTQLAVLDDGDHVSARAAHVQPTWRVGASVNHRSTPLGNRIALGVFAGLRTGPVAWLAEIDRVDDESLVVAATPRVALLEANWRARQGHNLKLGLEHYDPDTGADTQRRLSAVWEYTPMRFVQLRIGHRSYEGDDAIGFLNRTRTFAEVHAFF